MKTKILLLTIACTLAFSSKLGAQDIFSGAGIRGAEAPKQKSGWLFGRNQSDESGGGIKLPWGSPAANETGDTESTGWLNLPKPNWMQARDPAAPGFFQQAGEKSRAFWSRTNEGMSNFASKTGESFRSMNQNLRSATNETWSKITGSHKRNETMGSGVKPPVRNADNWFSKNKDR